jgi:hypothetical protein
MTYKPRRERRAMGGKAADTEPLPKEHGHQYDAVGSPEEKSESAKSDGFKRGGMAKKKRKEGGHVEGHAARHHLGKRARGGGMKAPPMERGEDGPKEEPDERKRGGHVEHHEEKPHRARGGHVKGKFSKGGAPFSAAHKLSPPGNDKNTGPGEQAETIP